MNSSFAEQHALIVEAVRIRLAALEVEGPERDALLNLASAIEETIRLALVEERGSFKGQPPLA